MPVFKNEPGGGDMMPSYENRRSAITFGEPTELLIRQVGITARYVYLEGGDVCMVEVLPHDPSAFSLVPEANRSKIAAKLPFIVAGATRDGAPGNHPTQRVLRTQLNGAVSELSKAATTDSFRDGQRIRFDYYDWQETMDKMESILRAYSGARISGLDPTVYAAVIAPNYPDSKIPVYSGDLQFSKDMDIRGLVMPPQIDKYDTFVRRSAELNFKVRDLLNWFTGSVMSVQAGTVLDLLLRFQLEGGSFEDLIHRVTRNIGDRVRSDDVARITVFSKVLEEVYTAYSDVVEPIRPTEILLRAKLAYNAFVYDHDYMSGFWRGDLGIPSSGAKSVGWLPVGERSVMVARGVQIGLIEVDLGKCTTQATVNRSTHTRPVLVGQETNTLGNGLNIRYEEGKDFYPVRGDAIGGFVKKSPESIFEGVEPHITNLVSRVGPFPLYPYSPEGMVAAMVSGNVSVLSGSEGYVFSDPWTFDKVKGQWVPCSQQG